MLQLTILDVESEPWSSKVDRKDFLERMRDLFRGYYRPSPDKFAEMWRESIFVFDTNVLLNIYRYTPDTRNDLFRIWEELQDRIWIPHQAIFEYFENRELVIAQQYSISIDLEQSLDKALEAMLNKYKKGHPFADIGAIKDAFEKFKGETRAILQKGQENSHNIQDDDIFLERITQLFDDKIGKPYSNEQLVDIRKCLDKRYEQMIPPGYKDGKKDGSKQSDEELNVNKYGDGILWFQIRDHAKSNGKSVIFITDDVKDDWWRREKGKTLGPRPELVKEIYDDANIDFYMYTADSFITRSQEFLGIQVRSETIKEVRDLRKKDEENRNKRKTIYSVFRGLGAKSSTLDASKMDKTYYYITSGSNKSESIEILYPSLHKWLLTPATPDFVSEEVSSASETLESELEQSNDNEEQMDNDE